VHYNFLHITTLQCTVPNFKCAHPRTNTFHAIPLGTAQCQILACAPTREYFFAQFHSALRSAKVYHAHSQANIFLCNATLHRTMPNFTTRTHTPIFSTYHKLFIMHHAFLVCPPAHIYFYAHQFLVNSTTKIGAFS
jgi:hypothetical protein